MRSDGARYTPQDLSACVAASSSIGNALVELLGTVYNRPANLDDVILPEHLELKMKNHV